MAAVRGSKLVIKRGDGADPEVFVTVGALQSSTLTLNGNPIEVTTSDDVDLNDEIHKTYITGPKELSLSGVGIGKSREPIQSIHNDYATGAIRNYEIIVPFLGTHTVPMIVGTIEFNGNYDAAQGFNISLQSAGAPTFVAETG